MMDWLNLFTGFGFKFRSLVNLAASGYALAALLPYFGVGDSGFMNLTQAANSIQLHSLGEWIQSAHCTLKSIMSIGYLWIVLAIWLLLVCLSLCADYKGEAPTNLAPNSAIASAFFWALWVDLVSPRSIVNCATIVIGVSLVLIAYMEPGKKILPSSKGLKRVGQALIGIVSSFLYVVVAPPLWIAASGQTR